MLRARHVELAARMEVHALVAELAVGKLLACLDRMGELATVALAARRIELAALFGALLMVVVVQQLIGHDRAGHCRRLGIDRHEPCALGLHWW